MGDWFEINEGEVVDMEVLIGEIPGEHFCAYLLIEKEGKLYNRNNKVLQYYLFLKTAEIPERVKDKIKYTLIPGEGDLDSELMFNVY